MNFFRDARTKLSAVREMHGARTRFLQALSRGDLSERSDMRVAIAFLKLCHFLLMCIICLCPSHSLINANSAEAYDGRLAGAVAARRPLRVPKTRTARAVVARALETEDAKMRQAEARWDAQVHL